MKKKVISLFLSGSLLAGCSTTRALRDSTIASSQTITDIQYTQVLDNLAVFVQQTNALPWALEVVGGAVTIADQLGGNLTVAIPAGYSGRTYTPQISGQRGWTAQWTTAPVADGYSIWQIRRLYQWAVGVYDEYNGNKFIERHIYAEDKGSANEAKWCGEYRDTLCRQLQTGAAGDAGKVLPANLLPCPPNTWYSTNQIPNSAFSVDYDKMHITVNQAGQEQLSDFCLYLNLISAQSSQSKNFLIGSSIR